MTVASLTTHEEILKIRGSQPPNKNTPILGHVIQNMLGKLAVEGAPRRDNHKFADKAEKARHHAPIEIARP